MRRVLGHAATPLQPRLYSSSFSGGGECLSGGEDRWAGGEMQARQPQAASPVQSVRRRLRDYKKSLEEFAHEQRLGVDAALSADLLHWHRVRTAYEAEETSAASPAIELWERAILSHVPEAEHPPPEGGRADSRGRARSFGIAEQLATGSAILRVQGLFKRLRQQLAPLETELKPFVAGRPVRRSQPSSLTR
jgi:hypothetical protein